MTVKELRDFLNSLYLDELQEEIEIISTTQYTDGTYYLDCDNLDHITVNEAAGPGYPPYISIITGAAQRLIESEEE